MARTSDERTPDEPETTSAEAARSDESDDPRSAPRVSQRDGAPERETLSDRTSTTAETGAASSEANDPEPIDNLE